MLILNFPAVAKEAGLGLCVIEFRLPLLLVNEFLTKLDEVHQSMMAGGDKVRIPSLVITLPVEAVVV